MNLIKRIESCNQVTIYYIIPKNLIKRIESGKNYWTISAEREENLIKRIESVGAPVQTGAPTYSESHKEN